MWFLFLCSRIRLSFLSVVFIITISLIDVIPLSPMLFPVDLIRMEDCIVGVCHLCVVSFVLTPKIEFSECCV